MNSNRGTGANSVGNQQVRNTPEFHQQKCFRRSRQRYERQPGPGQPVARLLQHGRVARWRWLPRRWRRRKAQVGTS